MQRLINMERNFRGDFLAYVQDDDGKIIVFSFIPGHGGVWRWTAGTTLPPIPGGAAPKQPAP